MGIFITYILLVYTHKIKENKIDGAFLEQFSFASSLAGNIFILIAIFVLFSYSLGTVGFPSKRHKKVIQSKLNGSILRNADDEGKSSANNR